MRQSVACLLVLLYSAAVIAQTPAWKYCPGSDGSTINISGLQIQPFPIKKGSPMKFTANGTTVKGISQRNGRMDVYTSGTKIFSTAVGGPNTIGPGQPYSWGFTYTIPSFIPPGNYDIWVSMMDTDFNTLSCVAVNLNF